PKQPWIYISDPADNITHADKLKNMIDGFSLIHTSDNVYTDSKVTPVDSLLTQLDKFKDARKINKKAFVIMDKLNRSDSGNSEKIEASKQVRKHAAKSGRTFASVNLYLKDGTQD